MNLVIRQFSFVKNFKGIELTKDPTHIFNKKFCEIFKCLTCKSNADQNVVGI